MQRLKKDALKKFDEHVEAKDEKSFLEDRNSTVFQTMKTLINSMMINIENIELVYVRHVRSKIKLLLTLCKD